MTTILAVFRKDMRLFQRDRSALIFVFGLPMVFALLFGMIYRQTSGMSGKLPLRITVLDRDSSPVSQQMIANLHKMGVSVHVIYRAKGLEKKVMTGKLHAALVLPAGFGSRIQNWAESTVPPKISPLSLTLWIDPAHTTLESVLQEVVNGSLQRTSAMLKAQKLMAQFPAAAQITGRLFAGPSALPAVLHVIDHPNPSKYPKPTEGDKRMPGLIIYFVFFMASGVAVTLIEERQTGTLRRMLSAPVSPFQVLAGKMLARCAMGCMQISLLLATGIFLMHLTMNVNLAGILLVYAVCIFTATGLGLLIATFGKTQEQIQGMTTLALLVMGLLSGCLFPRELLPPMMLQLSYITPHAWALAAVDDMLLRRLSFASALPSLMIVLMMGCALYAVALKRFQVE